MLVIQVSTLAGVFLTELHGHASFPTPESPLMISFPSAQKRLLCVHEDIMEVIQSKIPYLMIFDILNCSKMTSFPRHTERPFVSFLGKTLSILENPLYESIVAWDPTGRMIQIKNQTAFEDQILSRQFKHKNIKSFVRQLNMYGFKKAKKGVAKNSFYHPHFLRDSKEEIRLIRRRKNCRSIAQENTPPEARIHPVSKKSMGSQDTIVASQTQNEQPVRLYQQPSVKDVLVQQYMIPCYYINPWSYTNEDIFQYEESFEYALLPSK